MKRTHLRLTLFPKLVALSLVGLTLAQFLGCARVLDYRERFAGEFAFHIEYFSFPNPGVPSPAGTDDYNGEVFVGEGDDSLAIHYLESQMVDVHVDKSGKLPQEYITLQATEITGEFEGRNSLVMQISHFETYPFARETNRIVVTGTRRK